MKNKFLGIAIALGLSLAVSSTFARVDLGSEGVGGGNIAAAEFADLANGLVVKLAVADNGFLIHGFKMDYQRLRTTVDKMKIFTVNHSLILNGNVVQAINDPQKMKITFNQTSWAEMGNVERSQLVLHELIGLTFPEISDLDYVYSRGLLKATFVAVQTPDKNAILSWTENSPVVKGITSGIEVEHYVTCAPYKLSSWVILSNHRGATFQVRAYCYTKKYPDVESGSIITINGATSGAGLPIEIINIEIGRAG